MSDPVSSSGPTDSQSCGASDADSSGISWGELAAAAGDDEAEDGRQEKFLPGPFIQLGHTTLPVSEALQLEADMIVRLQQSTDDLVWLIVDGQPRAAGMLLEVDGQFALQITELADSMTTTGQNQQGEDVA